MPRAVVALSSEDYSARLQEVEHGHRGFPTVPAARRNGENQIAECEL
jgi:hypothetical protein